MKRVVLVGLGLIGGSIGLALRSNMKEIEIVGVDTDVLVNSQGCRELLTYGVAASSDAQSHSKVRDADLVVLSMPVCAIAEQVGRWLSTGLPVTDCGSTKAAIAKAAEQSPRRDWFLPGHPMAGRERGGLQSADPELFRGRRWIVCPEASVHPSVVSVVREVVGALGAVWTEMTVAEHDRAVALTSHLPQIIASWLATSVGDAGAKATGPAFTDMTRVAGGSEAMWRDIFLTNAEAVSDALMAASADFAEYSRALRQSEPDLGGLLALLERARSRV